MLNELKLVSDKYASQSAKYQEEQYLYMKRLMVDYTAMCVKIQCENYSYFLQGFTVCVCVVYDFICMPLAQIMCTCESVCMYVCACMCVVVNPSTCVYVCIRVCKFVCELVCLPREPINTYNTCGPRGKNLRQKGEVPGHPKRRQVMEPEGD